MIARLQTRCNGLSADYIALPIAEADLERRRSRP
jgi:hypothetical protein